MKKTRMFEQDGQDQFSSQSKYKNYDEYSCVEHTFYNEKMCDHYTFYDEKV